MIAVMIGLMDCNNFFVSCERLFRPDLLRRPVAVLSSNDGCIVARSQEVKDLGVPMGAPYFQVKKICDTHQVTLFSSNFTLYRDLSARVMAALRDEVERMEVYSIDEAFFEPPSDCSPQKLMALRQRIIQKVGIPISIGLGPTKTIAKMASIYAKKGDGVYVMDNPAWQLAIKEIECGRVWGIGRQTARALRAAGIVTVADFLRHDQSYYRAHFGVIGERLLLELSGTAVFPIGMSTDVVQHSLTSTRSFPETITDRAALQSALTYHLTQLGEKLRAHGWLARELTVLVAPSRFGDYALRSQSARAVLSVPTDDTLSLIKTGLSLFDSFYDSEVPYKRAGAIVHDLLPRVATTGSLFAPPAETGKTVDDIVDTLNRRYGKGVVQSALGLRKVNWIERSARKSSAYTTNWTELPVVKAK